MVIRCRCYYCGWATSRQEQRNRNQVSNELSALAQASHQAGSILGAQGVELLDLPDNRLNSLDRLDLIKQIQERIARHQPMKHLADKFGLHLLTDGVSKNFFSEKKYSYSAWRIFMRRARYFLKLFTFGLKSKTWIDHLKSSDNLLNTFQ